MPVDMSKFQNKIIAEKVFEEREGNYCDFPDRMLPQITDYLIQSGINNIYTHQAEMFNRVLDGENIIITTSTASGKTLSFLLPIVQEILKDPTTRALFIYPTKALASDQLRSLQPLLDFLGRNKIQAGIYDGDTPVDERRRIRNSANIILTNPEMLNSAFLPHHSNYGFNFIFSNLKYLVIDELHSYRGTFGSHLANVFRRLARLCKFYHTSPQFLCSSATIANPVELARNICGNTFFLIDGDGSPASEKHFYVWQPPLIKTKDSDYRIPSPQETAELIPELILQNSNFLVFCKSRKIVEVVLKEARDGLKYDGIVGNYNPSLISGYRGGYKPQERKEIETKMINGEIKGLVSTNALELGIDIGKIETVIMTGFPGTRASFWQQAGRAGRRGNVASIVLILDYLPFDQYIGMNIEWLFDSGIECAVVDKNNLFIQLAHVRAAAAELPLSLDDTGLFPDLGEIVPVLLNAKELKSEGGRFVWCGKEFPAGDYSLRNIDNKRYCLKNTSDDSLITEMDEQQAFRELFEGAIYLHNGLTYQVVNLDIERRLAEAKPTDINYYTEAYIYTGVNKIKGLRHNKIGRTQKNFGDIKVSFSVPGYKKIQFHNHQNLGFEKLNNPLGSTFDTEGMWIVLPQNVCEVFNKLLPKADKAGRRDYWDTYYDGLCFCLLNAAMMITMTTKSDISSAMLPDMVDDVIIRAICIFDMYIGGLGYAEKAYDYAIEIVKKAIEMVSGCKCKNGCPICVGDYHLDKNVVLWGLNNLFEELSDPKNIKVPEAKKEVLVQKPFRFDDLQERWTDFIQYLQTTGEYLSVFLSLVEKVSTRGSTLTLVWKNEFYNRWVSDETNKQQLHNIIFHYVQVPADFTISIQNSRDSNEVDNGDIESDSNTGKRGKIVQRLDDLTG